MAFLDEEKVAEQEEQVAEVVESETEEIIASENEEKTTKDTKDSKKEGKKGRSKVKATFGELKKVTWPSFGKVVKQTVVVLSVTLIFLIVIMGIDQLLYHLFNLIKPGA